MTFHQIEGFEFLPGALVLDEDDVGSNWSVRVPAQLGLDTELRADHAAALGANVDRIVGRVVCRLKDGTPAIAAMYLDAEGGLHWTEPLATECTP